MVEQEEANNIKNNEAEQQEVNKIINIMIQQENNIPTDSLEGHEESNIK